MSDLWEADESTAASLARDRERSRLYASMSFAERHPYIVRDGQGAYDSRWTNYQVASDHANLIGGYVDAPAWHEDVL